MVIALFDSLGGSELFIVGIAALLVFGKKLPEVASQAGKQIAKLRHGVDKSWKETGLEEEIRDIKQALPDVSPAELARSASRRFQQRVAENARREGLDPAAMFQQQDDVPAEPGLPLPQGPIAQGGPVAQEPEAAPAPAQPPSDKPAS